ncbi:MAG: hypothetical protein PHR77_11315 [Kiritimatiellae bacterium]|nr:hypothetical protein [Kiritimatiellia bacterium]MDD5522808.1 hypothetical protein [Kiritimatiellia bacterium]
MRKVIAVMIMMASVAAGADEIKTLGGDTGYWRGSVKPEFKITQIADETAELVGIQAGPSMNRGLYLGVCAYGLVNDVDTEGAGKLDSFDFWYGGFVVDYTMFAREVVHGSAGFLIGCGEVNVGGIADDDSANLFMFEPCVNLMVNVTKGVELGIGVSYRFMNGSDIESFEDSDLSGVAASIFVRWNEE